MKIGFVGLGIMGSPMVKNLLEANREVYVFDLNEEKVKEAVALGAIKMESLPELAEGTDVVITMLPNAKIVKSVLLEEGAVFDHLKDESIVIDMSSLSPSDSIEIGAKLALKNITFADAPVSGGEPLAVTGELSVMIGCKEEKLNVLEDIISPMAKSVIRVGDIGAGATVKLANQIIVNANITALSEAVVMAKKFDIELNGMFEAIRNGLAGSNVMEAKFPKMIEEDYTPGGTLHINYKDLNNVTSTCDIENITLPLTSMVKEMYKSEIINGHGSNDHSGIIKYIEKLNNI